MWLIFKELRGSRLYASVEAREGAYSYLFRASEGYPY
jgi:hypothetical protein